MNKTYHSRISRFGFASLSLLTTLALCFALLPQTALAAAATTCASNYTVKSTDTTSHIAHLFKLAWIDVANANNLKQPYMLTEGQRLCIPAAASTTSTPPTGVGKLGTVAPTAFTFGITSNAGHVVVNSSNYTAHFNFKVKVQDVANPRTWYPLGILKADSGNKNLSSTYLLPDAISSAEQVRVCLKDQITGALFCRVVPHTAK